MNCLTNVLLFIYCSRPDFGWSGPKRPKLKVVWFHTFTVCVKRAGPFEADLMKENLKEVSCRQPIRLFGSGAGKSPQKKGRQLRGDNKRA